MATELRRNEEAEKVSGVATQPLEKTSDKVTTVTEVRDIGKPRSPSGDILDLGNANRTDYTERTGNYEKTTNTQYSQSVADTKSITDADSAEFAEHTEIATNAGRTESSGESAKASQSETAATPSLKAETASAPAAATATEDTALVSESDLTPEQEAEVAKLQARDAEVRTHEAAHLSAAGPYAQGGASYTYETGPDGRRYAVGGEVSIDASPVSGDPQATIAKMQTIRNAALAPASPSSQDYKVAAAASREEAKARMELSRQATENTTATGAERTLGTESSLAEETEEQNVVASADSLHGSESANSSNNAQKGLAVRPGVESNGISPLTTNVAGSDLAKSLGGGASENGPRQPGVADLYLANSRLAMGDQTQTRGFGIFA